MSDGRLVLPERGVFGGGEGQFGVGRSFTVAGQAQGEGQAVVFGAVQRASGDARGLPGHDGSLFVSSRPMHASRYVPHSARPSSQPSDTLHSEQRFDERLASHASGSSWACVVGDIEGAPVGFAYGRLDSVREWREILEPVDPAVRAYGEDGTFGLCEIMVRRPWRGKGIARGIHDDLMGRRPEQRAFLLVDSEHPKVRALYESWGYRKAGQMQPFEDSPRYDAMVLDLH